MQDFLIKIEAIINQMRSYGEKIFEKTIVTKVLKSLLLKFDDVVVAIKESNNLSTYSFDELMGPLQDLMKLKSIEWKTGMKKRYFKQKEKA